MTTLAIAFMAASWSFVLGLTAWCFFRVLRSRSAGAAPRDGEAPEERPRGGGRE